MLNTGQLQRHLVSHRQQSKPPLDVLKLSPNRRGSPGQYKGDVSTSNRRGWGLRRSDPGRHLGAVSVSPFAVPYNLTLNPGHCKISFLLHTYPSTRELQIDRRSKAEPELLHRPISLSNLVASKSQSPYSKCYVPSLLHRKP